jgi:hypothetical protein
MKQAKVIKKKRNGFFAFFFDGKGWMLCFAAFIFFMFFSLAMPLGGIPGLGRLAALLGISPDSMRSLTLSDFVAYAAGVEGNRVYAAQLAGGFSSYDLRGGGLSLFSYAGKNRLLDARAAYQREYELTGKWPRPVAGSLSMAQTPGNKNPYEGVPFGYSTGLAAGAAPVIDPARAASGQYGDAYGNPVGGIGAADAEGRLASASPYNFSGITGSTNSSVTIPGLLPAKPVNPHNIMGSAKGSVEYIDRDISSSMDKLRGGRLAAMGGFNAQANRVRAQGPGAVGQYGFMDLGANRSLVYSYSGAQAGYKTTAKFLAEAAFDGGEPEAETLIVPGEAEQVVVNSLTPPNTILNKMNAGIDACSKAREEYKKSGEQAGKQFKEMLDQLYGIGENSGSNKKVPGTCVNKWVHKDVIQARHAWNSMLDEMQKSCKEHREGMKNFTGKCGINYNPSPKGAQCEDLNHMKVTYKTWFSNVFSFKKCKNTVKRLDNGNSLSFNEVETVYNSVLENEVTGVDPGKFI